MNKKTFQFSILYCFFAESDVVNLISVDCPNLQKAFRFLHFPWSCPLQIIISLYFQKILYTADMAHSGKQLHCIYEQRDMEGNNMFEGNQDDEDETLIIVRYLEPSSNETEWLQHAVVIYNNIKTLSLLNLL